MIFEWCAAGLVDTAQGVLISLEWYGIDMAERWILANPALVQSDVHETSERSLTCGAHHP